MPFKVLVCLPVRVPSRFDQHRLAFYIDAIKSGCIKCAFPLALCSYHYAVKIGERSQFELRQVATVFIAMERTIKVRARVGHHLDLANLEFRAWCIVLLC